MCYLPFLNEIKLIYHTISAIGHPAKILSIKKKKKKIHHGRPPKLTLVSSTALKHDTTISMTFLQQQIMQQHRYD